MKTHLDLGAKVKTTPLSCAEVAAEDKPPSTSSKASTLADLGRLWFTLAPRLGPYRGHRTEDQGAEEVSDG